MKTKPTPPETLKVYDAFVDGSSHQDKEAAWAFIVVENDKVIHQNSGKLRGKICSLFQIGAELTSIINAVKWAKENNCKINLTYDLDGALFWGNGSWKCKNEWTKKYFKFINNNRESINSWVKVVAHSGNKYNNLVDKLVNNTLNS